MTRLPSVPSPGEHRDAEISEAEAVADLIPDGEMPGPGGLVPGREAVPTVAVEPDDDADLAERDPQAALRRSGTDMPAILTRRVEISMAEARLDGSSGDLPHETIIDPAQDNAGLQPDLL